MDNLVGIRQVDQLVPQGNRLAGLLGSQLSTRVADPHINHQDNLLDNLRVHQVGVPLGSHQITLPENRLVNPLSSLPPIPPDRLH